MEIPETDDIDFLEDDDWAEKLLAKLEAYPKLHDPLFQKYLDYLADNEFMPEEDFYYELIILEFVLDGVMDVASVDDDGGVIFAAAESN